MKVYILLFHLLIRNMKRPILYTLVRVLAGLMFVFSGVTKVFPTLIPMKEPELGAAATKLMEGFMAAGYFLPVLGLSELIIGLMLLFNFWPALATLMLVPISLNILLVNVFLVPSGMIVGILVVLFNAYLVYHHWERYKYLIKK